jgi:hypothetical protein
MDERFKETQLSIEQIDSEKEDYLSSPPEYRILTYPADFTLQVLHLKMQAGDIDIPTFQRGFVWNQAKASKLIESFLMGLPVPPVFLYSESSTKKLLVIDGQQRLKSIRYFFEGYFGEPVRGKRHVFKLRTLNEKSKWFNRAYDDLTDEERRDFDNKVLRAFIVEQLDPQDNTSVYHIFERLNTGGTLLNNQEIRNSLYHGKLNELLKELNLDSDWRLIVGKAVPDNRQRDTELILRFVSLYYDIDKYQKPMKDFMNDFMAKHTNPESQMIENTKLVFRRTCEAVREHLGTKPFHVRAGLNTAVFDSVFVNFAKNMDHIPGNVRERYRKLIEREDYYKLTRDATTDVNVVNDRLELVRDALFNKHK